MSSPTPLVVHRPAPALLGATLTGWSAYLPAGASADAPASPSAGWTRAPAVRRLLLPGPGPDRAHEVLGRKGLLGKDDATRLALCAVHRALGLPDRAARTRPDTVDRWTAVVVSCSLGVLGTVTEVAATAAAEGARGVSPLLAPSVSANVTAAAVALRHGWGGPNLTVIGGARGGLDAVLVALRLLRTGRARRAVVVGCEPGDAAARAAHRLARPDGPALRSAAACLLLSAAGDVAGLRLRAARSGEDPPGSTLTVEAVTDQLGDAYGAAGVLAVALAAARAGTAESGLLAVRGADGPGLTIGAPL
jgi:hypothetical protein